MRVNLPGCPELPELPPMFWAQYNTELAYWQKFFANPDPDGAPIGEMRATVLAAIRRRLKTLDRGGKNAGRALFELSGYLACLTVIDSRN
jgi:hypothetical protein